MDRKEYIKKYNQRPEVKEKNRKRSVEWIKNNPERWKEISKRSQRKRLSTPEGKKKNRENAKRWIKNNREKWNGYQKERWRKISGWKPTTKKCILCGKEHIQSQPQQKYCSIKCRKKIANKQKEHGSRKKLQWKILYSNPFDDIEKIDLHHINTIYVIPLPSDIHRCYGGYHTRDDNEDLDYIIEQIYPSFDMIKNSLRQS